MSELLTVEEIATLLRVRPQTIYLWANQGRIPVQKLAGWALRFERRSIEKWLKSQKREAAANG